jgi:hypothetical protein
MMIDLTAHLPARHKKTASGWISFNAPCCVHNGETADRRQRGGLKSTDQGWSYHCFNCGFTASFVVGRSLSFKARRLLSWLNVPADEIERINLESLRHRTMEGVLEQRQRLVEHLSSIDFEERDLPTDVYGINGNDDPALALRARGYLRDRGVPMDYPYLFKSMPRPGIVVPFTHDGVIVGHSTRFLDDRNPRYIHDIQSGYVFGRDLQRDSWTHVIVVEGVFDALSISAMAVLHADISDLQARLIRSLGREVTVVPDRDEAGMRLVDRAMELGWSVSMPDWPEGVKDVNDAVKVMGRVPTLITIMQARETNRVKIELRKRKWLSKNS